MRGFVLRASCRCRGGGVPDTFKADFCGQLFLGKFVVAAPRRPAKEDPGAVRKVRALRELVNLGGSLQSFETESFFPDPVGTRSETWPRRPRAGFYNARKCAQSPCKIFWAIMRLGGAEVCRLELRKIRNTVKRRSCFPNKLLERGSSSSLHGKSSRCVKLKSRNFGSFLGHEERL